MCDCTCVYVYMFDDENLINEKEKSCENFCQRMEKEDIVKIFYCESIGANLFEMMGFKSTHCLFALYVYL